MPYKSHSRRNATDIYLLFWEIVHGSFTQDEILSLREDSKPMGTINHGRNS